MYATIKKMWHSLHTRATSYNGTELMLYYLYSRYKIKFAP